MTTQRRLLAALAVMAVVTALPAALPTVPAVAGDASPGSFDLSVLPGVDATGAQIAGDLEDFVAKYPLRLTGTPNEMRAAEDLRTEMAALGYEAAVEALPATVSGNKIDGAPLRVVTAMKRGTSRPDEWIMLVGHYDTIAATVEGAYDNGSGTNMLRFLARELAQVPTNRSIVFAWYNGEEEGLLASAPHAQKLKAAGQRITAVLGFDMVGVAWPIGAANANSCLCLYHGAADGAMARPLLEQVNYNFLGFPRGKRTVSIEGTNIRNSDEQNFARQGYRTLRWTGLRTASSYPAYHLPNDTMQTIDETAGGREFFEAGSRNTLLSAYYTALALDNHVPEPTVNVNLNGATATFDAAASRDPDGDVTSFVWDFGDGTTATGPQASHTYAAPGTYEVRVTVADNLWPAVTRSETVSVLVE